MKKLLITLALLLIPSLALSIETKRTTDGFLGYLVDNSSTGTSALSGVRMVNDANTTMGIYLTSSNYSDSDTDTGLITGILKLIMDTDVSVSSGHTFSIGSEQWNSGDKIDSSKLDAVDVAADEECFTWEDGSTKGEWQACAAGGDMTKEVYDEDDDGTVDAAESDYDWTVHDDYPAACYAGEFVTEIGDALTCAAEDDPEVDAVTADKWCKGDGSAVQCTADDPGFQRTQEEIDDFVDALINDGDSVHTRITITYDDADNAMDFVVDDMSGGSGTYSLDDICDVGNTTDQWITVAGLTTNESINMADDKWIGLSSGSARIEFDDQTIDEVNILNANVGIGTQTPNAHLEVSEDGDAKVILHCIDNNDGAILDLTKGASSDFGAANNYGFRLEFNVLGSNQFRLVSGNQTTTLTTLCVERNSGNVGIGDTSPDSKLEIAGAITLQEMTAPGTPAANKVVIYVDGADGDLKAKDDDGEVIVIADFAND